MAATELDIRGIIVPTLTPFDRNGSIDYAGLEREIDYIADVCQPGAIALAATEDSEYTMLSWADRIELIRRGSAMARGRTPLIVGISHPATERALELAALAKEVGADAVQVLLPIRLWGGDPEAGELFDYVDEIAAHSPLPVVIGHNRGPGADPSIDTYLRLAEIRNAPLIVDTSGDITRISRLIEELERPGLARIFATAESLLISLTLGASGASMPPPAAYIGCQVVQAFEQGDLARAGEWQRMLGLFPNRWARYGAPPVMKAAMRHLGIDLGRPMSPYGSLAKWDDAAIGQFLEEVGLKEPGEDAPPPQPGTLGPTRLRTELLGR